MKKSEEGSRLYIPHMESSTISDHECRRDDLTDLTHLSSSVKRQIPFGGILPKLSQQHLTSISVATTKKVEAKPTVLVCHGSNKEQLGVHAHENNQSRKSCT